MVPSKSCHNHILFVRQIAEYQKNLNKPQLPVLSDLVTYAGPGTLIDLSGSGDFSDSFTLASPTVVKFVADDCCVIGDQFGLILDGSSTAWSVSPVPESETYAMLLAGLGILGFAARRKQQKV